MIFLTVGTQLGFDRLVQAVDELVALNKITERVFAQIGPGRYLPKHMEYVRNLEKNAYDHSLKSCDALISHAGMGSISMALQLNKPLLVLPRRKCFGEVVNDHQVDTARRFEALGHILVAYEPEELADKIALLKTFQPVQRQARPEAIIERIRMFLDSQLDAKG